MKPAPLLIVKDRTAWRSWLAKHHRTAKEIWLVYYKKESGLPRIPYTDAVEEALCYGWIDSTMRPLDARAFAQRFSPRRPKSDLSELNKERIRRLIRSKKMRKAGLDAVRHHMDAITGTPKEFRFPPDIVAAIRRHPKAWKHYRAFPLSYRRIRIGWIDGARARPEEFDKRLRYFIAKTEKNVKFGMK